MTNRYFVEIFSPNKQQLLSLQKFELDLFQSTVKTLETNEFSIEGLITLDDVNKLVAKGYKVVVKKQSPSLALPFQRSCHLVIRFNRQKQRNSRNKETGRSSFHTIIYWILDFRGSRISVTTVGYIISIYFTVNYFA